MPNPAFTKLRQLLIATLLGAAADLTCQTAAQGQPAVIIDSRAITSSIEFLNQAAARLQQVTQLANSASTLLNFHHDVHSALGLVGPGINNLSGGTVGELLQAAQLGMRSVRQAANQAERLVSQIRQLETEPLHSYSPLEIFTIMSHSAAMRPSANQLNPNTDIAALQQLAAGMQSASRAMGTLQNALFAPITNPGHHMLDAVIGARRTTWNNATISSYGASIPYIQTERNPNDALAALATGVANSTDKRGDLKANSAIMLKVLEGTLSQTGLLAKFTGLRAVTNATQLPMVGASATLPSPPGNTSPPITAANASPPASPQP